MRKWMLMLVLGGLLAGSAAAAPGTLPVTQRAAAPDPARVTLTLIASGFERPLYLTHAGDGSGRLFVVDQFGRIWVMQNGARLETPFLDISSLVSRRGNEQGLLGLAFHPQYAQNGVFFVNYSDAQGDTVVARYRVAADNPNRADPASAEQVIWIDQPFRNHNGGGIAFGPDGYLYVGMGDGGSQGDPEGNGQNPKRLLGKMLRLDVDGPAPYGIPADNPFVNNSAYAPEIWALGLRNPWRFSFDRATGDLYIADVGQTRYEEVNFQAASSAGGENYGWNIMEGSERYSGAPVIDGLTAPFAQYNHGQGCSVTGGYVYRGQAIPDLAGVYLFGDYCSGLIWASWRDETGSWQTTVFMDTNHVIASFGEDEAGELYLVDHSGSLLRFDPAG